MLYRIYQAGPSGFPHTEVYDATEQPIEALSPEDAIQTLVDRVYGTDPTEDSLKAELGSHFRAYPVNVETERLLGVTLLK